MTNHEEQWYSHIRKIYNAYYLRLRHMGINSLDAATLTKHYKDHYIRNR